jgi:hypothetical protein
MQINVHDPALFPEESAPGTHCTGRWVVPSVRLDVMDKRKISCHLLRIEPQVLSHPVRSLTWNNLF